MWENYKRARVLFTLARFSIDLQYKYIAVAGFYLITILLTIYILD